MKKTLVAALLLLPLWAVAGVHDSLMQQFVAAYKLQRTKDHNYAKALFRATESTINVKNKVAKKALCALKKPDTTAIKILTTEIVSRFITEDLLRAECGEDYETNKEVIQFYSTLQCNCLTKKNEALAKNKRVPGTGNYMQFVEKCRDEINEDTAIVNEMRNMVTDMSRLTEISHCVMPYLHVNCPLIREDFQAICVNTALAAYYNEQKDQEKKWKESLVNYLMSEPAGDMDAYYTSAALCTKTRQDLYVPARRVATLNATHQQVYCTTEFANNKHTVTFVYSGRRPEVLCQVEFEKKSVNLQYTITAVRVLRPSEIKNKEVYLMGPGDDIAPPMKKLN